MNVDGNPGYLVLRRDSNNYWSYKYDFRRYQCSGASMVRNIDFSKGILWPDEANLGPYDQFGGYYEIPESGILFIPRVECAEFDDYDLRVEETAQLAAAARVLELA